MTTDLDFFPQDSRAERGGASLEFTQLTLDLKLQLWYKMWILEASPQWVPEAVPGQLGVSLPHPDLLLTPLTATRTLPTPRYQALG